MTKQTHFPYTSTYNSTLHNTNTKFQGSKTQSSTTAAIHQTFLQTETQSPQQTYITNIRHKHTSILSRHLATRDNYKILRTPPPHLSNSDGILPSSLVTPLPYPEQINHHLSNNTYAKSTPNHIYHHYAPSVTPTYAPRCHSWICGQTPLE